MLPTHLKSVVACGCSFSSCNCGDSVLIIIKSTCMTGCRPLMGAFLCGFFFKSDNKSGAAGKSVAVFEGRGVHESEFVRGLLVFLQTSG